MNRFLLGALALSVAAVVFLVGAGSGLLVDGLWFSELGYFVVFRTILGAKVVCFAIASVLAFAVIAGVGLNVIRETRGKGVVRVVLRRGNGSTTIPELIAPVTDRLPWRTLVAAASAALAILFGLAQAANWRVYMLWLHGGVAGFTDPFFGREGGFFLFTLPAYQALTGGCLAIVVLAAIVSGSIFWLQGALEVRRPGEPLPIPLLRTASLLLGLFLVVKAGGYWLARYEMLLEPYGAVHGVGYTTAYLRIPFQWLLCLLAIAGAGLSLANLRVEGWRLPVVAIVMVAGAALASSLLPDLFHRLRVRPDELRLERPYLEHNIAMTRKAYGLDAIEPRPFAAATTLDAAAIERNRPTLRNIRLWDPGPLLDTYRQLQVIRLYYDFHDIDVDRYDLPGGRRQVMLAAREIVPTLLPANARTWVNQRLQFTHGFGAVMSPVTEFEGEGMPTFFLKDIPPVLTAGLEITEPRIYFGERTDEYVLVKGETDEFDYPKGDENVSNSYAGKGGVALGSWIRRLFFAWNFRDVNLLVSGNIGPESRILYHREISERIQRLAPFLRLDRDPYLVVSNGRLHWIQDAYTTAATFPYSEPVGGLNFNYIRNPVKVVVDAYEGTVEFFVVDPAEPVLAAYASIFPGLFRPVEEMAEDLRRHVRYPEDLFLVQAEMYRAYHMTRPDVFYNKEDLWSFPSATAGGTRSTVVPYYIIMRLPGEKHEEFVLMQPMTPSNRNNMVAWLAARSDPPHYGQLVEYEFPKERLIYGPQQVEARIDQDTIISQQLSLWNQMGSKVIRGNLLVIPIEDSVLYVEPLYLRSEQGQIPELKRVIVAYGERVAMAPSLEAALDAVFRRGAPPAPPPLVTEAAMPQAAAAAPARETAPVSKSAREHYRAALEALRGGDWASFGREMDALEKALDQN